jgi:hypothetical protein
MSCLCHRIPLIATKIDRIKAEVAKLRQAITNQVYGERSVVGDAVLVIEGQLKQVREALQPG